MAQLPLKQSHRWTAALVTGIASAVAISNKSEKKKDADDHSYRFSGNNSTSAVPAWESAPFTPCLMAPTVCGCQGSATRNRDALQRKRTVRQLEKHSTKASLESKYIWHKNKILGHGAYGSVYLATSRDTNEDVAMKDISKKHTNSLNFQQEMRVMLYTRSKGGHPHVCSLHEHFDSKDSYYVVLDYIGGGEMFDHMINNGAYSEFDASRLVREVASALNFLHGIGVVHADLKPENILLTTPRRGDAVVKLADFGCAQIITKTGEFDDDDLKPTYGAPTPAYCPPESILKTSPIQPSSDMWGLGVILFIMLTGSHPYDVSGQSSDEVVEELIKDPEYKIPIDDPEIAGHLSASAKNLISKLMDRDPERRLTAFQMLQHPWVRGETATTAIIAGSDKKLSKFRHIKTKLQARFFEDAIKFSDSQNGEILRKTSLVERSFKALDIDELDPNLESEDGGPKINMSDFENLLSDNMKNQYFPAEHVVYREGDRGNHMYFIDSGTIEVETSDGSRALRSQGDFFGEGALLHPRGRRSATIRCKTPVHAMEISREYFEKYISSSTETGLYLTLKEKDKIRKRNRAKTILKLQRNLKPSERSENETYFHEGSSGDTIYILETGKVDLSVDGKQVMSVTPGNIFGEHSVLTGRLRNCNATCASRDGCVAQELPGHSFRKLVNNSPHIRLAIRDLQLRREFKKAVVKRLKKEFPYDNPQEAFQAVDEEARGFLDRASIAKLLRESEPDFSDAEIQEMMDALDITKSGIVTFDEFTKVFIGNLRTASSM
jgi:serine/threonine protein kinase